MPLTPAPIVAMESEGKPVVLKFNIPEPTSYTGRNYQVLDFPAAYYVPPVTTSGSASSIALQQRKMKAVLAAAQQAGTSASGLAELERKADSGQKLVVRKKMSGKVEVITQEAKPPEPQLILVEVCRLSTYLGQYGAGRTIKTFTLLPGEKTKISIKAFTKTSTEAKEASSILDSFTEESADDFENSVNSENSDKSNSTENFEYHAEIEAEAKWGWGKAKVSGGVKGSSLSSRESFSKSVMNATQKHSMKASAKRDVQVNTSYEVKTESGEETSTERELQNINVGRTLNFIFRQMNQEFITALHLVDLKLAYYDGREESKFEMSLSEIDNFLEKTIKQDKRAEVKLDILNQVTSIMDYKDEAVSFVEQAGIKGANGTLLPESVYYRVRKGMVSEYADPVSGTTLKLPGVILSVQKNVMRTDGVMVECVLGQGEGLDDYSRGLQLEAVRTKKIENDKLASEVERNSLAARIINDKDASAAEIFNKVYNLSPVVVTE